MVAVVILNWNAARKTIDCAKSVLKSDYPNLRVVIVDNGSHDDSVMRIEAAGLAVDLVRSGTNLGFGGGMNLGLARAAELRPRYCWLLNNDTEVDSHSLTLLVQRAERCPNVGILGAAIYERDGKTISYFGGGSINVWLGISRVFERRMSESKLDYIGGASMFVRQSLLEAIGGFDDQAFFMFWEDADFSLRARQAGYDLGVETAAIVTHEGSGSFSEKTLWALDEYFAASLVRFLRRYSPIPAVSITLSLFLRICVRLVLGRASEARALWRGATKSENREIAI